MAAARPARPSSFSRAASPATAPPLVLPSPGVKPGPNSTSFISSGIPDLDKILGGGFAIGSLVMVIEDAEAPHHLLLLRNFMAQGLVHKQPLLFASPSANPRAFLGTLPAPVTSSVVTDDEGHRSTDRNADANNQGGGLRIAWQYKKYFGEQQLGEALSRDRRQEFGTDFDLRKTIDRQLVTSQGIDCISIQDSSIGAISDRCSSFLSDLSRDPGSYGYCGRIAIHSLGAPQCGCFGMDWDMVCFIRTLKAMLRSCNAVAVITFPASVLSQSFSKRWQHLADTLLSVRAIPDDDKDLAKLLTGYQDMVGFLHVHKVAQINTQVPVILEARTYSMKLQRRRSLILERLNQAPIDGSSGSSYATSSSCFGSSKGSPIDF